MRNRTDTLTDNDIDDLLFVASQQFDKNLQQNEVNQQDFDAPTTTSQANVRVNVRETSVERSIDELLLAASQKYSNSLLKMEVVALKFNQTLYNLKRCVK